MSRSQSFTITVAAAPTFVVTVIEEKTSYAIAGASVYWDGAFIGSTGTDGKISIASVSAGSHTLKVTASGCYDNVAYPKVPDVLAYTKVMVRKQWNTKIRAFYGSLEISGFCDVYLDNVNKGKAPLTLLNVPSGDHRFEAKGMGTYWDTVWQANVPNDLAWTVVGPGTLQKIFYMIRK